VPPDPSANIIVFCVVFESLFLCLFSSSRFTPATVYFSGRFFPWVEVFRNSLMCRRAAESAHGGAAWLLPSYHKGSPPSALRSKSMGPGVWGGAAGALANGMEGEAAHEPRHFLNDGWAERSGFRYLGRSECVSGIMIFLNFLCLVL